LHVLLPDETTATLPEWMFDAAYCQAVVWQETPVLGLSALRELRRLVDAARLPCNPSISTKEAPDEATK
jgi:hypothetical protein